MSTGRPSLPVYDSDGYSGEDSIRDVSPLKKYKPQSPFRSIRYEDGQVRKETTFYTIQNVSGETSIKKMSRMAGSRLAPLMKILRQCKSLIRPLHSRYYPFCIAFYILLAAIASCYFFGATPSVVTETVLEPVAISVGDAVSGMKEKMGEAYGTMGVVYKGVKERIMVCLSDAVEKGMEGGGKSNGTSNEKNTEEEEKERDERIGIMIRKELAKVSDKDKLAMMRSFQEEYAEWSDGISKKITLLEDKFEKDSNFINDRLIALENEMNKLRLNVEDKMSSVPDNIHSIPTQSMSNFVTIEELRMYIENMKKEVEEVRHLIPREEEEEYENLASYTHGASIIDSVTSHSLYSSIFNIFHSDRTPLFLLTERQLYPGDCMPLPSTGGVVGIKLSVLGYISHIEYYHLYWSETGGIPHSAPKEIKIMGCTDDDASLNCEILTECEYTVETTKMRREEAKRRRIFGIPIECPVKDDMQKAVVKSIRLQVQSNHGAEHTCLYLTRVLGKAV